MFKKIETDINQLQHLGPVIWCMEFLDTKEIIKGITLAGWLTYYLAKLNQIDPLKTPWVEYFKKKLE